MKNSISFFDARKKLIMLWLVFCGIIILLFLVETITNRYTEHVKEVLQWIMQFITPSLTLMIGVLVAQINDGNKEQVVDRFYFRLTYRISFFFLLLLFLSPFLAPIIQERQNANADIDEEKNILDAFRTLELFLLPVQGVTMLSLGLFFSKNTQVPN